MSEGLAVNELRARTQEEKSAREFPFLHFSVTESSAREDDGLFKRKREQAFSFVHAAFTLTQAGEVFYF